MIILNMGTLISVVATITIKNLTRITAVIILAANNNNKSQNLIDFTIMEDANLAQEEEENLSRQLKEIANLKAKAKDFILANQCSSI